MKSEDKKIISNFILFLESENEKWKWQNGGYSYAVEIRNFIEYIFDSGIALQYENAEERQRLLNEKAIIDMNVEELRKYIFMVFSCERFSDGLIMSNIKKGKLATALKKLITDI